MGIQEMLQWWNLVYVIPLFVSVIWLLATAVTGMHDGAEHDHDIGPDAGDVDTDADVSIEHDLDVDHDVEVGHDLDVDHDVEVGHDLDADHDAEVGHEVALSSHAAHHHDFTHDQSVLLKTMALLGFGKVPVAALMGVFLLSWGAFGMLSNRIFEALFHYPVIYIWPSLAATFLVSAGLTRATAGMFARFMPTSETYGVSRMELTGLLGKAVFKITESAGTIDIRDQYGTIHREQAKVYPDSQEIPAGSDVMVIEYDDSDKRFVVKRSVL